MWLCSCHAVSDRDIKKQVRELGCPTWKQLVYRTRCATQCGKCVWHCKGTFDVEKAIFDEEQARKKKKEEAFDDKVEDTDKSDP